MKKRLTQRRKEAKTAKKSIFFPLRPWLLCAFA